MKSTDQLKDKAHGIQSSLMRNLIVLFCFIQSFAPRGVIYYDFAKLFILDQIADEPLSIDGSFYFHVLALALCDDVSGVLGVWYM